MTESPMNDDQPAREDIEFRIRPALCTGFLVFESGEVVAAFDTSEQACAWIANMLRPYDPMVEAPLVLPDIARESKSTGTLGRRILRPFAT